MPKKVDLTKNLKELQNIVDWFSVQNDVPDLEVGIVKAAEGARLVKESRERLKEIENTFEEIKKDLKEE
ncbi:MAG: hypothetical protein KC736_03595 [Candidatus Moranbacteria bacterium]|nr:hypothetical protein [Candidatus Moranbacteria bacterium]